MRHSWVLPLILLSACMTKAQTGPCTEAVIKHGSLPVDDDAYFYMPPYGKPVTGQSGVQAADTKSFSDRTNIKRTWRDDHRIVVSSTGDMAYEDGTMHVSYDSKSEGHNEFNAVILAVYRAKGGECQTVALTMQPLEEKH
jgi:hypothetical protein